MATPSDKPLYTYSKIALPSQCRIYTAWNGLTIQSSPKRYRWIIGSLTLLVVAHGLALGIDTVIKYAYHGIASGAALEIGPAVILSIVANAFVDLIVQSVYAHRGEIFMEDLKSLLICSLVYIVLDRSIWAAVPLALSVLASFASIICEHA